MSKLRRYDADLEQRLIGRTLDWLKTTDPIRLALRDVALAENTSTNAIYALFGGKKSLIEAACRQAVASLASHLDEALGTAPNDRADVTRLASAYQAWVADKPVLYLLMFCINHDVEPVLAPFRNLAAQLVSADSAEALAVTMWAAIHGHVHLAIACDDIFAGPAGLDRHLDALLREFA